MAKFNLFLAAFNILMYTISHSTISLVCGILCGVVGLLQLKEK